jgi:type II restriction/modification system DNA methylase subunit YeeA
MGTFLGKGNDPRYTPSTTFETFPFPADLTPNIPAADYAADPRAQAIAAAAARLNELRENWLNPPDLVKRVPEVVPGYPDRILPIDDAAATGAPVGSPATKSSPGCSASTRTAPEGVRLRG